MSVTVNGSSGLTFGDGSTQNTSPFTGGLGFRNRIINGDFRIDQRNAGASVTPTVTAYTLDRWNAFLPTVFSKFSVQQASTAPNGFVNSLLATSTSAYSVGTSDRFAIRQMIEGFNIADLGFGTAAASPVTISFWVRSSITGTFGGAIQNSDADRSYPFSFTINSVNTFEQKSITIQGDTSGTWLTNNGIGIRLLFSLGAGSGFTGSAGSWQAGNFIAPTGAVSVVGTNGATFYITGVQLEKGSTATSFDYRPYGTELALCQRYYFKSVINTASDPFCIGFVDATTSAIGVVSLPVEMRVTPTALEQSGTAADYRVRRGGITNTVCSSVPTYYEAGKNYAGIIFTTAGSLTAGQAVMLQAATTDAFLAWSAEL